MIIPAVPSPNGVADVFGVEDYGTVHAIRSDGSTAWTAATGLYPEWMLAGDALADFQGGMVARKPEGDGIVRYDGLTGQVKFVYPRPSNAIGMEVEGAHPDGTIFASTWVRSNDATDTVSVIGIDGTTGAQKFSATLYSGLGAADVGEYRGIIAGDGCFYIPFLYREPGEVWLNHLILMKVDSNGAYSIVRLKDWVEWLGEIAVFPVGLITNADQGVVLTWVAANQQEMAITAGAGASYVSYPCCRTRGALFSRHSRRRMARSSAPLWLGTRNRTTWFLSICPGAFGGA